jgi:hypothetical protein
VTGLLGHPRDEVGLGPDRLEPVERAAVGVEHVRDDVAEVGEHPAARGLPLGHPRLKGGLPPGAFQHAVDDRPQLSRVVGGGDDEEVGDERDGTEVEDDEILGLLVAHGVEDQPGQRRGIQRSSAFRDRRSGRAAGA